FYPGPLWQTGSGEFESKRKIYSWFLAGNSHSDDGAGALIKYVIAQNNHWASASLLGALGGSEIGPANVSPQYGGHSLTSASSPISAKARSSRRESLAHSLASRDFSNLPNFSSTAFWIASLRLLKTRFFTRLST